jgi:hypothetical protein
MSGIDDILAGYESLRADQEAYYLDLHQHPELSHAEHRTARRVAGQLGQRLSTSLPLKRTPRPRSRCMISGTLPAAEALP